MSDLFNLKPSQIMVYSTVWCPDCKRAKQFFGEHRIPYTNVDIEQDKKAFAFVEKINSGMRIIPSIIFPDGEILVEPSNAELANKLGLTTKAQFKYYDTIIIGSGPAGLTAAFYLAREGVNILVIEKGGIGGQVGITQTLDNFPGFDEGVSGNEFANRLERQAEKFGAEILKAQEVKNISREGQYLCVETESGESYGANAILLATGAEYRRLEIPGEQELIGINVHFCATCDGAFYKGKKVLVIGGGNSGFEEGLFLTKFASQVDIVEFAPEVNASQILKEKVAHTENMSVTVNHEVKELRGGNKLETILVADRSTGEEKEWKYDGVFIFIGLTPNNVLVDGHADIDNGGFLITNNMQTSMEGVFAAGDVRANSTKQAVSAAGEGASAAIAIREYLDKLGG